MILLEFDKSGAEWVIVAYLSGDARMIDVAESGKSPHIVTGALLTGLSEELVYREHKLVDKATNADEVTRLRAPIMEELSKNIFLPRTMSIRQAGKKSNHGLNYRETYKMFALINEIEEREAKPMCEAYSTTIYPGVGRWWEAIDQQLRQTRTFTNCFGRKARLLDAWGNDLKKKATAFIPQSTVSDMVTQAQIKAFADTSHVFEPMDLLLNGHDSLTVQYPTDDWHRMGEFCVRFGLEYLSPTIEYNRRRFKIGTDLAVGLDWGNMKKVELISDAQEMGRLLRTAYDELRDTAAPPRELDRRVS